MMAPKIEPKTYIDYDDPDCEVMDIVYDFFPDDFGRDIDGCRSIVYRRLITKEELLAGSEGDDPWYNNKPDAYRLNLLLENGLLSQEKYSEALYDLYNDPGERKNLINNPEYKNILENLKAKILKWQEETNDPLLSGEIKISENWKINKKTSHEPSSKNPEDYEQF